MPKNKVVKLDAARRQFRDFSSIKAYIAYLAYMRESKQMDSSMMKDLLACANSMKSWYDSFFMRTDVRQVLEEIAVLREAREARPSGVEGGVRGLILVHGKVENDG